MLHLIIFFILGFLPGIQAQNQEPFGVPISPEELLEIQQNIKIVDFRGDKAQELDGFIEGSILVPNPITDEIEQKLFNLENDTVVYVVDGGRKEALEVENILTKYGIVKFRCYLSGIKNWSRVGGKVEFPRFINFQALQESLQRNSILLIDVRNRTELNQVGQIPGSVCLPLHEVNLGFELNDADFLARYGFLRPHPDKSSNVVLTCRSGRRVLVADQILKQKGYLHLRIYSGSFKDWVKNQGEIIVGQFDLDYDILV